MFARKFGISCPRCGYFSYRDGVHLKEDPHTITFSGLASVSLSIVWPKWPFVHKEFDFLKNPNRAFLLMEQDFPRYIWHSSIESRLYYAYGLFELAEKCKENVEDNKVSSTALSMCEEDSLAHLKRIIYGIQRAKDHFDPRVEGEYIGQFVKTANLVRNILHNMRQKWQNPVYCEVCGLIGDRSELHLLDDKPGCNDCDGQAIPFDLDKDRFLKEMSSIEYSKLIRKER